MDIDDLAARIYAYEVSKIDFATEKNRDRRTQALAIHSIRLSRVFGRALEDRRKLEQSSKKQA